MFLVLNKNDSHYMNGLRKIQSVCVALTAILLIVASCGGSDNNQNEADIVVSTSIIADIVSNIVAENAHIEVLIPVGADPHEYQPSSRQVASINTAALVVVNGLGLEEGLADTLATAASDGANILELAPLVEPIPFVDAEALDPHFWMDPLRVTSAATLIGAAFDQVAGGTAGSEGAATYSAELMQADTEIVQILDLVDEANRKLVTNHDSMGYFANRYKFEIVGTVIPGGATIAEPSSKELADLVSVMEAEGVNVLFAETTQPTVLADTVAAELGDDVEIVELFTGSLGGPGSGAETLIELILTNARLIAGTLG